MFLFSHHLDIFEDITHDHHIFSSFYRCDFGLERCCLLRFVQKILFIHGMYDGLQVVHSDILMIVKSIRYNSYSLIVKEVLPHLFICYFAVKENGIK